MHVLQLISPILILLSPDITEYNKIYEQNMIAYNLKKTTTACLLFIITPSLKEKQKSFQIVQTISWTWHYLCIRIYFKNAKSRHKPTCKRNIMPQNEI